MSQPNPVTAYALHKDAEAFAQIVTQYQRLVFATCRRQLRNPADVDDAVQETFLRLAQRAAELHTNVGAWLHRCATNVSTDINRRRATRQRHEATAAALPKPADDAQRTLTELREHLDAALQKLDPDARELIIDRYFLGHAQVDLAAAANVAPSTITHRLSAAITSLRQHLNSLSCAALTAGGIATLADALQAEHASAAVPPALTANLMKIGLTGVGKAAGASIALKLIMATLSLLVAGIGAWLLIGQTGGSNAQIPPATQPATITVRSQQTGDAAPPNWKPTPTTTQWAVLAGRVLDPDGNPIRRASIQLIGPESKSTRSDDDGAYAFPDVKNSGDYTVRVSAPGFIPIEPYLSHEPALQLSADAQARRDFVLERGVRVNILVTDPAGLPMPNASVTVTQSGQQMIPGVPLMGTDKKGLAYPTLPISKESYGVAATQNGYAPQFTTVRVSSSNAPPSVKLTLQKGLEIRGLAICSDQKPAAGWKISAQPEWWQSNSLPTEFPIDKDGNFTLKDIGPGRYVIWLSTGNSSQPITTVTFPPTTQPMRFDLPMPSPSSMVKATGRLRFKGKPPEQLQILVSSLTGDREFIFAELKIGPAGKGPDRIPAGEGEYTFTAPPGPYRIQFQSPYIAAAQIEKIVLPAQLSVTDLNVIGKPHLTGTVTDAAGAPIPHFAVRVRKWETIGKGANYVQNLEWTQVTDPAGRFDIECVGPGIYQAQISANDYAWLWSPKVRLETGHMTEDLKLSLSSGSTLTGTILDPAGKPVAGAKVIPLSMARTLAMGHQDRFGSDAGAVLTDPAGHFTLPHLTPGEETLKILHPHFAPLITKKVTVTINQSSDAGTLTLLTGGTVQGTVRDNAGKPVAGVAIQFQDTSGYAGQDDEIAGRLASATTDPTGQFRVEHLPDQILWVTLAEAWSHGGVIRRVVHPLEARTAQLDFGGITPTTGRLSFAEKPYANKRVELSAGSSNFGTIMVTSSTDSDGNFTFAGPPPGRYTLFCQAPGRASDWIPLRDVDITDKPADLGPLTLDVGDLTIHIAADDPAMASSLYYISVDPDAPKQLFQESVAQAGPEADHWKAQGLPAGHFKITAYLKNSEAPLVTFSAFGQRNANDPQTHVTLHLPKPTATLKLINTHTEKENLQEKIYVHLLNQDASVMAAIPIGPDATATAALPPGTYRAVDSTTFQPRPDIDPIILKPGESHELRADFSKADPNAPTAIALCLWSADGLLITSPKPRLLDPDGHPADSWGNSSLGEIFVVPPAHYNAIVDLPGRPPFTKEIDVRPSDRTNRWTSIDIILPQ